MKTFCILEQGGIVNEPLTLKKKEMFTTDFSDFYRLNWREDNDPNAFITAKGITFSEGRCLLYEKVPKNYEYYIFIDDDGDFYADDGIDIPTKIKSLLDEYRPISGTFYDPKQWAFVETGIKPEDCLAKRAFPVAGFDEQVNIFSRSFADVVLPAPYHGACRTFWYCQWACHNTYPSKQVCFTEVRLHGYRSGGHNKNLKPQHCEPTEILYLFNRHVKDKSHALKERSLIAKNNIKIFNCDINKKEITFTARDLKKVYNIDNIDWWIRKPIASKLYLFRKPWNRFWWKLIRRLTGQYR